MHGNSKNDEVNYGRGWDVGDKKYVNEFVGVEPPYKFAFCSHIFVIHIGRWMADGC